MKPVPITFEQSYYNYVEACNQSYIREFKELMALINGGSLKQEDKNRIKAALIILLSTDLTK